MFDALDVANRRADGSRVIRVTAEQAELVTEYAETLYTAAKDDADPGTRLPDQNAAGAVLTACRRIVQAAII
ncbi:hypothetical protein [Kineococcus radiotolerans]|uniref:Uncharacterized protein n=1 Tax=Kineococcus radiotolerans (strain ATCC BAA-149 / DSM 14245 / SRS30216) TaxID=266940 RepID=A6WH49_KINRD|nr:hypothetical protein [Kineococcus radiotolerans]ABS06138.1 hypothetical protein Krad_4680 [Kineococcus radiotolerans SRS30216 = ATCC BAA-149]